MTEAPPHLGKSTKGGVTNMTPANEADVDPPSWHIIMYNCYI